MKKLIQFLSILITVAGFSILSANAQTAERYKAEIPFDFQVGSKAYQAGEYFMRISIQPAGRLLIIEDSRQQYIQQVLVTERGQVAKKSSELVFNRYDNKLSLAGLRTTENGFSIPGLKRRKQLAGMADFEAVSVDLK